MTARVQWLLPGSVFGVLVFVLFHGGYQDVAAQEPCAARTLPQVSAFTIPLDPTDVQRRDIGQLRYRGGLLLQHRDPRFGSFSGIVVRDNGSRVVAVNNGYWLDGALRYDGAGDLSGFELRCFGQLLDQQGQPVEWWEDQDAESLTFDGEQYLVGFEENLRVWSYPNLLAPAKDVALPADFSNGVPPGAGYSSLASEGPGTLYVITEFARNAAKDTKGYMRTRAAQGNIWIVARDGERVYLPVDLAVLPDGNFVLAEITPIQLANGSFDYLKLRLSIIDKTALAPGARITPRTIAEMEPPIIGEKYEAVAARSGPNGQTLIYIMSDDGRRRNGRTVIRMFELASRPE